MKKVSALLLALVMVVGLMSGCGGSGTDSDAVVYGYNGELGNLDPNMRDTNGAILASITMFDTLLDPYTDDYVPKLAEHYDVGGDGTEYTFYLRDDVTFHDGTKLTAKDIKYSIENNMESPLHAVYSDGIKDITVINDLTVKVTTEEPSGLLLYNLAHIFILPSELHASMTSEEFAEHPIGCGPYKFVSKNVSGEIVMEAYEDYFLGEAEIKTVKGYSYTDDYSRAIALENGEIDIGVVNDESVASLEANEKTKVVQCDTEMIRFLVLNTSVAPLDNPTVREAIAYAINRDMIVQAVRPESGIVNSILCAPSMEGYSENVTTYDYNPEKAKELLAEAGITTPYDLGTLDIMAVDVSAAEIIQSNLADIGLNVTIQQSDTGAFFDIGSNGSMITGIFGGAWGGAFGHFIEILDSSNIDGGMNWSHYNSAEFDAMMQKAISTVDKTEREENYRQALEMVQTDLPLVGLYSYDYSYGVSTNLNAVIHTNGFISFYEMSWDS